MAKQYSSQLCYTLFLPRGGDYLLYFIAILSIFSILINHLSLSSATSSSHFEGFDADDDDSLDDVVLLPDLPLRSPPPPTTLSSHSDPESHHGPPLPSDPNSSPPSDDNDNDKADSIHHKTTTTAFSSFDYWDEDEFEGLPEQQQQHTPIEQTKSTQNENQNRTGNENSGSKKVKVISRSPKSYTIEILSVSFLVIFAINYFIGRRENENLALAWAGKFAVKDSIFEKNFSLLGVGEGDDSPLLLKEGQSVFKFYASGRRFCSGLLATIELKSRHDLISRLYNMVVPCKDEISFEVYMNDDAMDQVVFALAKKKLAKTMQKEERDLQRFATLVAAPSNRKWVVEDLGVISESKEVAGDFITEAVLDQVFGEKAYEKYGEGFISMHFSDQHPGSHRKKLMFKFALPDATRMDDMTRLVALVPYYIDLIGRYKLSSQAKSKTDGARQKVAQEMYRELQNARQEALQKKKADRKKMIEEAEAKLNAEAIRKKEAKERARQLKKGMPKVKMSRAH